MAAVAETIPKAENAAVEESPEVKNSFDLPLMEDTALLVTVEKCRSNYAYISAEYEYDVSGHCVKLWTIYCDDEEDEEGDLTVDSGYMIWEKEYDDRGRLIKAIYCQDKEWYNYIYTMVGDADDDYPYDRIKMSWF